MSVGPNNSVIGELLEALGLAGIKNIRSLELRVSVDELVTVTIERYPEEEELRKFGEFIKENYELSYVGKEKDKVSVGEMVEGVRKGGRNDSPSTEPPPPPQGQGYGD